MFDYQGDRYLRQFGGPGDKNVALIGGHVQTVRESITTAIARQACDDAVRRTLGKRKLHEIPLIDILDKVELRVDGHRTSVEEVSAEIGRLYNKSRREA